MTAFRFMHQPATEEDFRPPVLMGNGTGPHPKEKCARFALSFFDSLEAARKRFRSLNARIDAHARYGSHVGVIPLEKEDGVMSEPSREGHMDLHPAESAEFCDRIAGYAPADLGEGA